MHRARALVVAALTASAMLTAPASAATDQERFEKKIGKSAVRAPAGFPDKIKGACVCPSLSSTAGVLRRSTGNFGVVGTRVIVDCVVPGFDANGNRVSFVNCLDFVVLPK